MNESEPIRRVERFGSVGFKLSDSSYSSRAIIFYYSASVLRECPVRDVNHILRGGGGLEKTSGIGGATLR